VAVSKDGCNTDFDSRYWTILEIDCASKLAAHHGDQDGHYCFAVALSAQVVRISTLGRRGRWWGLLSRPLQMRGRSTAA